MSNPFSNPPGSGPVQQVAEFSFELPEDPNWEPMEFADVLDKDGIYGGIVVAEKLNNDTVILTIEIQDDDTKGKRLSKFLKDPRPSDASKFTIDAWRSLFASIWGKPYAKSRITYKYPMFPNAAVFFKVESYTNKNGDRASGVGLFVSQSDWENAHQAGKARWAPKVDDGKKAAPAGLPPAFPALPSAPQPPASAPLKNGDANGYAQQATKSSIHTGPPLPEAKPANTATAVTAAPAPQPTPPPATPPPQKAAFPSFPGFPGKK